MTYKIMAVALFSLLTLVGCSSKPLATPPPDAPGVAGAGHTNPEAGRTGGNR